MRIEDVSLRGRLLSIDVSLRGRLLARTSPRTVASQVIFVSNGVFIARINAHVHIILSGKKVADIGKLCKLSTGTRF